MLAWMAYVILVGAVLGAAAWLAEKSADAGRGSSRWLWSLAILASLILPLAVSFVSIRAPGVSLSLFGLAAPGAVEPLHRVSAQVLAPARWAAAAGRGLPAPLSLDRVLTLGWIGASGLLALGILVQGVVLHGAKKAWRPARLAGVEVLVSKTVGPALVGLIKPRIVVPGWVEDAPAETQGLIIAHERTHLDADDALVLAVAILLIVAMPWNLPLWWQLHRLRFAIEADCDARVLRGGGEPKLYGRTLLMVAERHVSGLAVVAAMSEPKSNLEKRLRKMLSKPKKFAWATGAALAVLAVTVAAGAAEVSPPGMEAGVRKEIALAPAVLDDYVGFYSLNDQAILTVTREKDQLMARLTGQPAFPVFATAKSEFFYKVVKAELSFAPADGKASSVVLHQNGVDQTLTRVDAAALKIEAGVQAKVKNQTASAGTDAAVRKLIASTMTGAPDYSLMTPQLAAIAKSQRDNAAQKARADAFFKSLGPVQSITFAGVGSMGGDVYTARHENGVSRWIIALDGDGKISAAAVTPGP